MAQSNTLNPYPFVGGQMSNGLNSIIEQILIGILFFLPIISYAQRKPAVILLDSAANGQVSKIYANNYTIHPVKQNKDGTLEKGMISYSDNVEFDIGRNQIYSDSALCYKDKIVFYNVRIKNAFLPEIKGSEFIYIYTADTGKLYGSITILVNGVDLLIGLFAELDFKHTEYEISKLN